MTEPDTNHGDKPRAPRGYGIRWDATDLLDRVKKSAHEDRRTVNSQMLWLIELGLTARNANQATVGK